MFNTINVLVANKDKNEGSIWRNQLMKDGYNVLPECLDLSSMVSALIQEKLHIVMCSPNLIDENSSNVLKSSIQFFPRIKIVIVGRISYASILSKYINVFISPKFHTDLDRYYSFPNKTTSAGTSKYAMDQNISLLLNDNFLSNEEAAILLAQTTESVPGYVVIGIKTDTPSNDIIYTINKNAATIGFLCAIQYNLQEYYVILDQSPSLEYCIQTANKIRLVLFKETNAMFTIGISRVRNRAGELYACRKEAIRACKASYMYGQNNVIHIDYLDSNHIEYIYPSHKEERLIEATMDGDTLCAFRMLDDIFAVFRSCSNLRQSLINKIILGIIVNLNIAASSRVFAFEKIQLDSLSLKKLMAAKTIDEAYEFLKQGIEEFAGEMQAFTDISKDALFHKLSEIKEENKTVVIGDLAQDLNTTIGFMNSAIMHNCNENVFSFFNR